jgi:hypothetical protein
VIVVSDTGVWRREATYLANGLAVGNGVGGGGGFVARLEVVGDEGGAEGFDHEIVVVEGGDDDGGVDAGEGGGDVGGRHGDGGVKVVA